MVTGAVQAKYGIEEIPEDLYEDLMVIPLLLRITETSMVRISLLLPVGTSHSRRFQRGWH